MGPRSAPDLLRRRLELRRRAARLRLHRHPRPGRRHHRVPARLRHQPARPRLQPPDLLRPDHRLSVLPDPADDPDHHPGARRHEARMARGRLHARRKHRAILVVRRAADPLPLAPRHLRAALRQCLRRRGDRLCAGRARLHPGADHALLADPRRRARQSAAGLRARLRDDLDHRRRQRDLHRAAEPAPNGGSNDRPAPHGLARHPAWRGLFPAAALRHVPFLAAHEARRVQFRGLSRRPERPAVPADLRLFGRPRAADHRPRRADRGADGLLGAPAPACRPTLCRVHHAVAAGDPADRHRLRLYPALQHLLDPAADRQLGRHQHPDPLRLHHAGAALHVPRRGHRAARHRRRHPDRGGAEPRRLAGPASSPP